jgi:hypothetical protein
MRNKKPVLLRTVRSVVDAWGGTGALAEWAEISPSAVSDWLSNGWIPPAWYLAINAELLERGYHVAPSVFRQIERSPRLPDNVLRRARG